MKSVWIEPGCTTCGTCEFIAPEIFEVSDICHVRAGSNLIKNKEQIKEAAQACPVSVIKHQE
jgi:ferredoxin